MKKTNAVIFILCFVLVLTGVFSGGLWLGIGACVQRYIDSVPQNGFALATENFVSDMENTVTQRIGLHDAFVDINSLVLRFSGAKVVEKDDITVVKTASGTLANPRPYMADRVLQNRADSVARLAKAAEENGTEFVYVMAPTKGYALAYPANVDDYTASNCDRFILELQKRGVPTLNLIEKMQKKGISEEELFFDTDHHWRPRYAFEGAWLVADYLGDNFGFEYDKALSDIESYEVKTLKNWFLGSQGKKTGQFFAGNGADDIDIITPKFDTDLVEEQPAKGTVRSGTFADTVMYMENASKRDFYNLNPYAAYSGGDFREQIITNKLNEDADTILLVRDSFSCAMAPFLSLATSGTTCVDVRDNGMYVGEKINVYEYMQQKKPDYLVVMYTGVSAGDDLFDFE